MPDSVSWTEPPYKAGDRIDLPGLTVCAVMLTRDRPEYARRAVECFRAQTYQSKHLLILNSNSVADFGHVPSVPGALQADRMVSEIPASHCRAAIGQMRNEANARTGQAMIIIHWDDDDWSHPNRIAEQVALLQSSGAECVGYNEMLFWRTSVDFPGGPPMDFDGEAWLYRNGNRTYALGTSLCYWRSVWERRPFEQLNAGEDAVFVQGLRSVGVSSVWYPEGLGGVTVQKGQPRMIARIHAGNTAKSYSSDHLKAKEWRRVPEWDAHCRKVME